MNKVFIAVFLISLNSYATEETSLGSIEQKINSSLEEKVQLSLEKKELQIQIDEMHAKLKERKILLLKRLKALYGLKRFQWGELLTNTNFNSFNRNLKILNNLNKFDYELFKEYNNSIKQLALAQKNLVDTEKMLQMNLTTLERQQAVALKIETLHKIALTKSKTNSLLIEKGKLTRPLEGLPTQEYGSVRDQFRQYYQINRGELYTAKKSTGVKSVGLGVIIFRDELQRWRETLIVQHDDNYYSVYAGIKNSHKTVGDHVERNELLGFTSGDEFYFELRHFATAINPKKWYKE